MIQSVGLPMLDLTISAAIVAGIGSAPTPGQMQLQYSTHVYWHVNESCTFHNISHNFNLEGPIPTIQTFLCSLQ